jgi:type IV fimbrial biogenesis protein FimT
MGKQGGFTLTELIMVVAIVAILLSIAVPSYRYITNSYRMSSEVNGLLGDLMYARSEAIKEGQFVTVCVTVNGKTCSGNTSWDRGWLVFSNPNNGPQPPGPVLRIQDRFTGTSPDSFDADNGVSSVTYNREGFATTAAGFPNATITLHDPTANPTWTRCLWITPQGMLTVETPTNNPSGTCN